ncbi:hypothetical protein [Paraburkholderia sp. BR10954]|uniref:hypothetical protein n=1 Tax=Paraburkholderia sp. BR10954 TaxID=3236995 RepID=UPI0034D19EF2
MFSPAFAIIGKSKNDAVADDIVTSIQRSILFGTESYERPADLVSAGSHYSIDVIHQQTEVSSLRVSGRQLAISDPAGQCQALMAGLIFIVSQPDALRNSNDFPYFEASQRETLKHLWNPRQRLDQLQHNTVPERLGQ